MKLDRRVFIAGVAEIPFGIHKDDFDVLGSRAALQAMRASNINSPDTLQSAYVGNATNDLVTGQRVFKYLGLCGEVPIINVESACSSGAMAVYSAVKDVTTGLSDLSLAVGCENHSLHRQRGTAFSPAAGDIEATQGMVMTAKYALRAVRYMYETGATIEDLALVAVKNRRHAKNNPFAWLQKELTVDEIVNSRMIAYPLTLFQSCGITDGAGAVVVCSEEMIKKLGIGKPIEVKGALVTSGAYENGPLDIAGDDVIEESAKEIYEHSGLGPDDLDIVELHDAFTIAELIYYESLGLCRKGEGLGFLRDGRSTHGGKCVVSPRGGMLSYGHPIGASGAAQIAASVKQMRGECKGYQVEPFPKTSLSLVTGGGSAGTEHAACTMHLLASAF